VHAPAPAPVQRAILVVLDGLRPDAIPRFRLPYLTALARTGASTMRARTVTPSVTACAMASLVTGAAPEQHGLNSDRFHIPRAAGPLHPLPRALAEHGLPTSAFLATMPMLFSAIAHRIAAHAGVGQASFNGAGCADILEAARPTLRRQQRGLVLMHWPDGDRAGHEFGWMSSGYEDAVRRMDDALGALLTEVDIDDPATLVIAVADHGGGGAVANHHNSEHPLDTTIPLILAGGAVRQHELAAGASLLDVPATICWALGVPQPESFAGRPLSASFLAPAMAA
jgi:predicted AlkP superfamily pyrophosphatase or phosphodiesterase